MFEILVLPVPFCLSAPGFIPPLMFSPYALLIRFFLA